LRPTAALAATAKAALDSDFANHLLVAPRLLAFFHPLPMISNLLL
jgi:hypothetical protein